MTQKRAVLFLLLAVSLLIVIILVSSSSEEIATIDDQQQSQVGLLIRPITPAVTVGDDNTLTIQLDQFDGFRSGTGDHVVYLYRPLDQYFQESLGFRSSALLNFIKETVKKMHGRIYIRRNLFICWEPDPDGVLHQLGFSGKHIAGRSENLDEETILISLFRDQPTLSELIHEYSHANLKEFDVPTVIDEAIAYATEMVGDGLLAVKTVDIPLPQVFQIIKSTGCSPSYNNFALNLVDLRGLEPRQGLLVEPTEQNRVFYKQQLNSCIAGIVRVLEIGLSYDKNVITDLVDGIAHNHRSSFVQCRRAIQAIVRSSNAPELESLTILGEAQRCMVLIPTGVFSSDGRVRDLGFYVFYRDDKDSFPATDAVVRTLSAQRRINVPQGGGRFSYADLGLSVPSPFIEIQKADEPSVRGRIDFPR